MAQTINPAVSGSRTKTLVHVWAYLTGTAVGFLVAVGMVLFAFGALSLVLPRTWLVGLAITLAVGPIVRDLAVPVPLPYRRRQVPERWREIMPLEMVSFLYGAVLGFGFATLFTSSAHAVLLLALPFLSS